MIVVNVVACTHHTGESVWQRRLGPQHLDTRPAGGCGQACIAMEARATATWLHNRSHRHGNQERACFLKGNWFCRLNSPIHSVHFNTCPYQAIVFLSLSDLRLCKIINYYHKLKKIKIKVGLLCTKMTLWTQKRDIHKKRALVFSRWCTAKLFPWQHT